MGICTPPYTKVSQFPSTSRSILSPNQKIPQKSTEHPVLTCHVFQGASVVRMMELVVGEANFATALTNFLVKHAYSTVTTEDLWSEFQALAPNVNFTAVMDTWTRQMGYPVLTVTQINSTTYRVTQKRFLSHRGAEYDETESPYR